MQEPRSRRHFLGTSTAAIGSLLATASSTSGAEPAVDAKRPIKVVVWDEQQPAQKQAYDDFLGNAIAEHLRTRRGLAVTSVKLDDPGQGLSDSVLDGTDVLIWWGHVRQAEVAPETGRKIVERIKSGALSLIALHSAHWSTPFVEAMNARARSDLERTLRADGKGRLEVHEIPPPSRYTVPKADARPTPYAVFRKFPDGLTKADLHLPFCCFPAYRNDGKPSYGRVLKTGHPIVAGIPAEFELAHEEMYDEPFHVPEPDEVILEERWAGGEWFRSGMVWKVGQGRVFYFRPGHETYPTYRHPIPLTIVANAVRWLARPTN